MARERAHKNGKPAQGRKPRGATVKAADTLALEKRMSDALGLTVSIDDHGDRGGKLSIHYRSLDQLVMTCLHGDGVERTGARTRSEPKASGPADRWRVSDGRLAVF